MIGWNPLFILSFFVDWFSSCTHSSSPLSDIVALSLWCNHSSFCFVVYGCVIWLWPQFLTPSNWPLSLPFLIATFFYSHYIVHCCLHWFQQSFPFHCICNCCSISCDNHVHLNPLIIFAWMTWINLYLVAFASSISLYQISLFLDPHTPLSIRTLFSLSLHQCRLVDSDGRKLRGRLVDTEDRKSTEA